MSPTDRRAPRAARAAALVTAGFALLALAGILGVLSLASAELENPGQSTGWGTAAFATGALGAAAALVGALLRARAAGQE